jgi:peptidoglycan hydrolase-like protein with peptidoglycan-binding domain
LAGLTVTEVRTLQTELAHLGFFHHVVTGYYGSVTTTAVKAFQRSAGLKPDGIWGPHSEAALQARLASR